MSAENFRLPSDKAARWLTSFLAALALLSYWAITPTFSGLTLLAALGAFSGYRMVFPVIAFCFGMLAGMAPIAILNPYLYDDLMTYGTGWVGRHPAMTLYLCLAVVEAICFSGFYLAKCARDDQTALWFPARKPKESLD